MRQKHNNNLFILVSCSLDIIKVNIRDLQVYSFEVRLYNIYKNSLRIQAS